MKVTESKKENRYQSGAYPSNLGNCSTQNCIAVMRLKMDNAFLQVVIMKLLLVNKRQYKCSKMWRSLFLNPEGFSSIEDSPDVYIKSKY